VRLLLADFKQQVKFQNRQSGIHLENLYQISPVSSLYCSFLELLMICCVCLQMS